MGKMGERERERERERARARERERDRERQRTYRHAFCLHSYMCVVVGGRTYPSVVVARHDRHGTSLCVIQFFSKKVEYHNDFAAVVGVHLRGKGREATTKIKTKTKKERNNVSHNVRACCVKCNYKYGGEGVYATYPRIQSQSTRTRTHSVVELSILRISMYTRVTLIF